MNNIQILDCTLRDGGYINNWNFGQKIIRKILKNLSCAQIDIVECGFLSDVEYNIDQSIFSTPSQIKELLPPMGSKYVAMVALGEKEISYEKIPMCDNSSIYGIRLTFHKHEIDRVFEYAANLMQKGYAIFIQPVGTCTYSDMELLRLVERVNELCPYAFYIVDTLGTITVRELMHLFRLIDNNLESTIKIGFHSHNNLQLAFANSQELIQTHTHRDIIIDASVYGMGRGAGNLCTELIAQYMNQKKGSNYNVTELLEIVDKYLMSIKESNPWGYTIPYYISATNNCHPNYATYLVNKQTLNVRDIEKIIANIPSKKRPIYDKGLISTLYKQYQEYHIDDNEVIRKMKEIFDGKEILVLAPGSSLAKEHAKISTFIQQCQPYIISINFKNHVFEEDMIFISNLKRFEEFDLTELKKWKQEFVLTSNINTEQANLGMKVNYSSYLNTDDFVFDDAGLMFLQLLEKCNVKKVALAGFDGFFNKTEENYYLNQAGHSIEPLTPQEKTQRIKKQIKQLQGRMNIKFITTSQYEKE